VFCRYRVRRQNKYALNFAGKVLPNLPGKIPANLLAVSPTLQTEHFELVVVKDKPNFGPRGTLYSRSYQLLGCSQIGWLLTQLHFVAVHFPRGLSNLFFGSLLPCGRFIARHCLIRRCAPFALEGPQFIYF
jgi:hypothetical protein